jgi:hypothetical protein
MYIATTVAPIQAPSEPVAPKPTPLKQVILKEESVNWVFKKVAEKNYSSIEEEADALFAICDGADLLEEGIKERLAEKGIENLSDVYPRYRGQTCPLSWREEDDSWLFLQQKKIEEAKKEHQVAKKAWIVKKLNAVTFPLMEEEIKKIEHEALTDFFSGKKEQSDLLTFDKFGISSLF